MQLTKRISCYKCYFVSYSVDNQVIIGSKIVENRATLGILALKRRDIRRYFASLLCLLSLLVMPSMCR